MDGAGFNRKVYSRNFLKTLIKKTAEQHSRGLMDGIENFDMDSVTRCKTIGDFDNAVVAPIYGFSDKLDYYRRTSCLPYLKDIRAPFYVVNAMDDPFFDNSCYPSASSINELSGGDYMRVNYPEFGGHCGFMYHDDGEGGELRDDWMTTELARFVKAVDTSLSSPPP